jgi:phage terminase large subunit GpA-like protein
VSELTIDSDTSTQYSEGILKMAKCDHCGNEYDKAFRIAQDGRTMTFDSFECAIHAMAPTCAHCNCRIVGHGVEQSGKIYCCAHCAKQQGATAVRDRA